MIVVAVGSTALRVADFSLLTEQTLGWISGVGMAGVAAVAMAASVGDYQANSMTRSLNLIAMLAFAALIMLERVPPGSMPSDTLPIIWGAWAFVIAWTIVMRLDGLIRSAVTHDPPEPSAALASQLRVFTHDA